MEITSPEHDTLIALAIRTHLSLVLAGNDEQRAAVTGARNVLCDALRRVDETRYSVDGDRVRVFDRWTSHHTADRPLTVAAAERAARALNTGNADDGAAHLRDSIAAIEHFQRGPRPPRPDGDRLMCGCDPTRGQSCRYCDGTAAEQAEDPRVAYIEDRREHGDPDGWDEQHAMDRYERMIGVA